MSTIDKLTLELNADGVNEFIRSLDEADKSLKKIQDDIKKATESTDTFDKKQSQSSRKKSQQQKTDKKASDEEKAEEERRKKRRKALQKFFKQTTSQLSKMQKAALGVAGISFGINALANRSEKAVTQSTELGNESRTLNASAKELESFNTTLTALGYSAGQFSDFLGKLSTTQSSYMYGNVAPDDSIISLVNGIGALSGQNINLQQDSVLKSMDEIAKAVKSLDKNKLNQLITTFGVDRSLVELFNNNKYAQARKTGDAYARQTEALQERNANRKLDLTGSQTALKNQVDILGENFTPVLVKLNEIGARLLVQVNKLEPEFEKALPKLEELAKDLIAFVERIVQKLQKYGVISEEGNKSDFNYDQKKSRLENFYDKNDISEKDKDAYKKIDQNVLAVSKSKKSVFLKDGIAYHQNSLNFKTGRERNYYDFLLDNQEKESNTITDFNKPLVSKEKVNDILGDPIKVKKENIEQHNIDAQYRNTQVPSNNATTNINVNEVNINGQQIDTIEKFKNEVAQQATTVSGISHAQAFNSLTNTV